MANLWSCRSQSPLRDVGVKQLRNHCLEPHEARDVCLEARILQYVRLQGLDRLLKQVQDSLKVQGTSHTEPANLERPSSAISIFQASEIFTRRRGTRPVQTIV